MQMKKITNSDEKDLLFQHEKLFFGHIELDAIKMSSIMMRKTWFFIRLF
jgi:hypothetical protein